VDEGGGVCCTPPETTPPPPPLGVGLGPAEATEGSSVNLDSLFCQACLVARPNRPRMTTRPMPTIATSIAYSDSACPRRFKTERLGLVSTTMLRRRVTCDERRLERATVNSHATCLGSGSASRPESYPIADKQLCGVRSARVRPKGLRPTCCILQPGSRIAWPVRPQIGGAGASRREQESHRSDLNRRPLDYESSALPLSYCGRSTRRGRTAVRPRIEMPWRGFEPRRLSALPPQDSVSTSFTTRACGAAR
jgi:hypothetical protein